MIEYFNNKMTIPFMMIIFTICIYFYIEWRTKKIFEHKIKKLMQKNKFSEPESEHIETPDIDNNNIDIDSYIDPAQIYDK
jgi:hypothetical protein